MQDRQKTWLFDFALANPKEEEEGRNEKKRSERGHAQKRELKTHSSVVKEGEGGRREAVSRRRKKKGERTQWGDVQ